jgi:hypothetical protein
MAEARRRAAGRRAVLFTTRLKRHHFTAPGRLQPLQLTEQRSSPVAPPGRQASERLFRVISPSYQQHRSKRESLSGSLMSAFASYGQAVTCALAGFVPKADVSNRSKNASTRSPRRRGRTGAVAR